MNAKPRTLNIILWIVQGLLAALFLLTGILKLLFVPMATLAEQSHLPGLFMKFIGLAEIVGALGLILPGILRIRTSLTPLAAACLMIIMIGATAVTLIYQPTAMAILPFVTGCLVAFVAYGRWRLAPL